MSTRRTHSGAEESESNASLKSTFSRRGFPNGGEETAEVHISGIADVNLLRYANVLLLRANSALCRFSL